MQENVAVRGKLKKYAVSDWEKHVLLLLRKEFTSASCPQYYRLNGNESLGSNLKRKAVVEYPVITVALMANADEYPVAYDVIETIGSIAEEQQSHASEPEAREVKKGRPSNETGLELPTVGGTRSVENSFSTSEKGGEEVKAPVQSKGLLIEELQVAAH